MRKHKIEANLIRGRKKRQILTFGIHNIISWPYIRYLGILIDARLLLKDHIEGANRKVTTVNSALLQAMLNVK